MPTATEAAEQLLEKPSREFVIELVRWLDLRMADAEPHPFERELFVRAFIAAGALLPDEPPVAKTLEAARDFIAEPTPTRYEALCAAATSSYPYGPGDGCFAIDQLGHQCEPGTGCRSGSGCLACIAETVGYDATADAIRTALRSWLASK